MIAAATLQQLTMLCNATGLVPTPDIKGVALTRDRQTTAVVGYDRWTDNSVEMHIWVRDSFMTPGFVRACFEYPFIQAKKGLVIGVTPGNNVAALAMNARLGFVPVYTIKDGNSVGEDLVIQEMRRENCRWIRRFN